MWFCSRFIWFRWGLWCTGFFLGHRWWIWIIDFWVWVWPWVRYGINGLLETEKEGGWAFAMKSTTGNAGSQSRIEYEADHFFFNSFIVSRLVPLRFILIRPLS